MDWGLDSDSRKKLAEFLCKHSLRRDITEDDLLGVAKLYDISQASLDQFLLEEGEKTIRRGLKTKDLSHLRSL